jgi:hypothetical protein
MADTHLDLVKSALGITGEYQDATLKIYIDEVKAYMKDAGVPTEVINSEVSAGVIARGVTDLWNYNGGAGKLSDYFYQRVAQLIYTLQTGKIIYFSVGDWGNTYPINIEGVNISKGDKVTFTCEEVVKEYQDIENNCVLITFTQEESNKLARGTYSWRLTLNKNTAVITLVNDGLLIVN